MNLRQYFASFMNEDKRANNLGQKANEQRLGDYPSYQVLNRQITFLLGCILYPVFGWLYKWVDPQFFDPYWARFLISGMFLLLAFSFFIWRSYSQKLLFISEQFGYLILAHIIILTYLNDFDPFYLLGFVIVFIGIAASFQQRKDLIVFILIQSIIVVSLALVSNIGLPIQVFIISIFLLSALLIYLGVENRYQKEDLLAIERNWLQSIFNNAQDAILIADSQKKHVVDCNDQALSIFGVRDEETLINFFNQPGPNDLFKLAGLANATLSDQDGKILNEEHSFHKPNGENFWGDLVVTAVTINKRKYYLFQIRDVTERRRVKAELEENEAMYRLLAENANDLISKHTLQGLFNYASPACFSILGYTPEEMIGSDIIAIVHPDDVDTLNSYRKQFNKKGSPSSFSYRAQRKDGEYIWLETNLKARYNEEGQMEEIIAVSRNITERKEVEASLRKRENMVSTMAEVSNELLLADNYDEGTYKGLQRLAESFEVQRTYVFETHYGKDDNQNEIYFNATMEWHQPGTTSKVESDLLQNFPGSYFQSYYDRLRNGHAIFGKKADFPAELSNILAEFGCQSMLMVPMFHKNEFIGLLGMDDCNYPRQWSDAEIRVMKTIAGNMGGVIANRNAEAEIKKAKEEAEEAANVKADFLATMSHEIRTPMNAVIGMTNLLLETPLNQEQQEYLDTIKLSGNNLLDLINDILDFSKIESGNLELENQPFEIHSCIEDSFDLLANSASEKGLDLAYFMDGAVPDVIEGDASRMRQVLVNLVNNAVKFTDEGEIVVNAEINKWQEGKEEFEILFSVKDTGVGISKEKQDQLFQAFKQADSSTTREYGGTGLGLAISQKLVHLMKGAIWLDSKPGEGTTFYFTIQTKPSGTPPKIYLQPSQEELKGKKAFIKKDDLSTVEMIRRQLSFWGMEVQTVDSRDDLINEDPEPEFLFMHLPSTYEKDVAYLREIAAIRGRESHLLVTGFHKVFDKVDEDLRKQIDEVIYLPVKKGELYQALMNRLKEKQRSEGENESQNILDKDLGNRYPLNILIAEDNVINQKLTIRIMEKMGFKTDVVANGEEVIEALEHKKYDIILMDVQMPEMDGKEATQKIRKEYEHANDLVIIALTAAAKQEDQDECLEAGMDGYVSKPINFENLHGVIQKWGKYLKDKRESPA